MKISSIKLKETAETVAGIIVGVAAGSQAKKALSKAASSQLEGDSAKNYIIPGVLAVGGIVAHAFSEHKFLKAASLGLTAVGGAGLVNEVTGKQVVALGDVDDSNGVIPAYRQIITGRSIAIPRQTPVVPTFNPVAGVESVPGIGDSNTIPGLGLVGLL